MKYIVLTFIVLLSGCDFINNIKYKYYYQYKGEMLCLTQEDTPGKFYFSKLNTDYPFLEQDMKIKKFSKIMENEEILNMQAVDLSTGSSDIVFLDKKSGKLIRIFIGKVNENIDSYKLHAECR